MSAGELVELNKYDTKQFHFVSGIPYDWILPKVYGVIHHGGSGTTHMVLRNGCVSLIIPHIIDHYIRDARVAELGTGPRGLTGREGSKK